MTGKGTAKAKADGSAGTVVPHPRSRTVEDQSEVLDFLSRPASYGEAEATVTRIDTHGAAVFLVGARAFKLKHAVKFPYMDFSTLERRRAALEAELSLNRRTAPKIYLRLCPVTREDDGGLTLGGTGSVVDWLLEMVRFAQQDLFDRMADGGKLSVDLVEQLADVIAEFHAKAEKRPAGGGAAALER
jgi:aminoglycoside phosphotransferase family enzyme